MSEIELLTESVIDRDALVSRVMRRSDGALVVFSGVVRDHHRGRAVESILYEAYRPMARRELARIVAEVEQRLPDVAIAVQHRLGVVVVGEESIVIACSSPHRSEAFEACRLLIDTIKERVPIWKKERGRDGEWWVERQC